jgi:hypothetical protein
MILKKMLSVAGVLVQTNLPLWFPNVSAGIVEFLTLG